MLKKCKYLLGLFVGLGLFGFTCFSNAGIMSGGTYTQSLINVGKTLKFINSCWKCTTRCNNAIIYNADGTVYTNNVDVYTVYCSFNETGTIVNTSETESVPYNMMYIPKAGIENEFPECETCPECQECEQCPEIDTGSILSGSCDINYCVENGLCPTGTGSRSELVINDIVHEGKPLININIPDYIQWDYAVDENQYDIYVGSGYDQDYIDSVLKINSYRPDNKDFTQIFVSGLTLIFPYIFVALLIVFIWKLLKRIFR